jgi:tetratricopeptide (TPR) repeat protein
MLTPSPSARARWALAAAILLSQLALNDGSLFAAFLNYAVFIAAFSLIVREATPWLAERFSLPFIDIYFPNLHFPKPPLSYTLARHYRDQGRLEDAAEQYQKIIRYHPHEEAAYLELLEIADQMENHKLSGQYAALYHRRFTQGTPVLL